MVFRVMVEQAGTDAVQLQPKGRIRQILHVGDDRIVLFVPDHPGIGEVNVGAVFAFQHRPQHVVIVIQLHITQLHIRIELIEPVKFRLQRLKVIIASGYSDPAVRLRVERRPESGIGIFLCFPSAGRQ